MSSVFCEMHVCCGAQRAVDSMGSNHSMPDLRLCWFGWGGTTVERPLPFRCPPRPLWQERQAFECDDGGLAPDPQTSTMA